MTRLQKDRERGPISPHLYGSEVGLKSVKEQLNDISHLVSLTIGSSKIHELTLRQRKESIPIRPQIHVILRANTGSLKSTILREIGKHEGLPVLDEITQAGLVGTVDSRVMQLIPGKAWECRNKLLLLDEFRFRRQSDDWIVFLKLLEDQTYARKLGLFSSKIDLSDGDLYLRQENGQIEMKTRFATIIATMRDFRRYSNQEFKAFVNRCIPYEYKFTLDQLENVAKGAHLLKIKEYHPDRQVEIGRSAYLEILRFIRSRTVWRDSLTMQQNYLRIIGDLCRVYAVEGSMPWKFAEQVIGWKINVYNQIGAYYRESERGKQTITVETGDE